MDLQSLQNLPSIPADFFIFLVLLVCGISSFKRGFFKESLIAIAYVPYVGAMFYIVNEFIQGEYSFDSILFKCSAIGGAYLAYLFGVWGASKVLKFRLEAIDESFILIGRALAALISTARTIYFLILCLVFFNLHVNQPDMLENSKIASALNPYALKLQKELLSKGYINNEITLYEDAVNGTFTNGKYEHPIMKKMKESDKYKDFERQINEAKKQIEKEADMNQYLKRYGM